MKTSLATAVVIACLFSACVALAAPTAEVAKVGSEDLKMAADDALQARPFEMESPDAYFYYRGQMNPAPFGLTDATSETAPTDDLMIAGSLIRFDLGRPSVERELTKIVLWWSLADSLRSGIDVKFAVHDLATGEWRDLSDYYRLDAPGEPGQFGCLTLTFPAGEVKGFDSLRMYDGRPLRNAATTRWVELDVFTSPDNR